MEVQNALANRIDTANKMLTYDEACKQVLANKIILAWIMRECLKEYKYTSVEEIAERFIEGEPVVSKEAVHVDESAEFITGMNTENATMKEGTAKFDIKFRAVLPETEEAVDMIINVEAQNDFYPGYPIIKRGVYYGCRMISSQYGTVFEDSEYQKIKRVASVWICTNPPAYRRNTITRYHMVEESVYGDVKENPDNYDLITVAMVCLGGNDTEGKQELVDMLGVLLSRKMEPEEKKATLKERFGIAMTKKLEGDVMRMCNLSKGIYDEAVDNTLVETIKNLLDTTDWDIELCMDKMKIPSEKRQAYKDAVLGQMVSA